jgi:hypothetical protein
LSLFLACQHLSLKSNLRECEDQSWFKVIAVSPGYAYPRLKTTALDYKQYPSILSPSGHKKTPWSESASELYRPSDRRLSAK